MSISRRDLHASGACDAFSGVRLQRHDRKQLRELGKCCRSIAKAIGKADAVVSALGYSGFNPRGYKDVDLTGTVNLVEGAKMAGVKKFVLLTSLLTNAKAVGQADNPNYKFLNLFGGGATPFTP